MKVIERFLDIMGFIEEEDLDIEDNMDVELPEWKNRKPRGQVVPFTNKGQNKVILIEPEVFDDCQHIADNLKSMRTVIINLENLDGGLARRIIDFVGGSAYALGGTLQKIGTGIIIAVPSNVDISGDISHMTQPKEVLAWIKKINDND